MNYQDVLIRRRLARAAKPFYNFTGPNDWGHIADVRDRASRMSRQLFGRGLTPEEYAAVLFHDCAKHDLGADNHAQNSADRARSILRRILAANEADRALKAIELHDSNMAEFPSTTAELLASADANPPELGWMLNKSWNWQLRHGIQDPAAGVFAAMQPKYRHGGKFHFPGIYARYWGKHLEDMQSSMDELTPERALAIVKAYREANGLKMDEPGQVAPVLR